MQFQFNGVPRISFSSGSSADLAQELKSLGVNKPLIVTDKTILELGLLDRALSKMPNDVVIFSDVEEDPSDTTVYKASTLANEAGCDSVVGFGGGSSMDVAKLVSVLLNTGQQLEDYYGVDQITSGRVPLIQIPTTAGTGSEVTAVAIVTTGESTKAGVVSPTLLADAVLLDPDLTLGLPAQITAATGIDAMVHAVEAFTSARLKNPLSDMLALKALSLLSNNIRTTVFEGDNVRARGDMLLGAMLAGQAFANAPVGAVHALAYPLGGIFHIPHGLSNSLVLPHVLRFNADSAKDSYHQIAQCIGLDARQDKAAHSLADYFLALACDLKLPTTLSAVNIPDHSLEDLADAAMLQTRLLINNPREMNRQQALDIYQQAY